MKYKYNVQDNKLYNVVNSINFFSVKIIFTFALAYFFTDFMLGFLFFNKKY